MTNFYRKASPPTLGPAFEGSAGEDRNDWFTDPFLGVGAPVLTFDLSRLTWMDYAEMRWHPQVNASLSLITFMIHQVDWKITCAGDARAAGIVEENMRLIWTELVRAISQAYVFGYSPNVLEWDNANNNTNIFISKIRDLHPAEATVHWLEVKSGYRPPPGVTKEGGKPQVPKVKVYDGINKAGLSYPIPPEHTLWYPLMKEHNDWTGRKLLKAAFGPWFFSHLIHLYSNRYFERFGEPTPIGRYPDDDPPFTQTNGEIVTQVTSKQVIENALVNLRSGVSVTLPSTRDVSASGLNEFEYSIDYLESQMRGADFERYLSRLDEEISLAIFTPMLLMRSGDRGSLNLGVQHTKTWLWGLNAIAADLKVYIDEYICQRIKDLNVSPNAPRVEWVPRPFGKDNDDTIRAMVAAIIKGGIAKPDIDELGVALGMTLNQVREVNKDNQPPTGEDQRTREDRTDKINSVPNLADGTAPATTRA